MSSLAHTPFKTVLAVDPHQARTGRLARSAMLVVALALLPLVAAAAPPVTASPASVAALMNKDVIGADGKEVVMITVTYVPGGASLPHRHDAQVFVYVLEGAMTMQIRGQPIVTLHSGETFYEALADVHQVSANASETVPAKILVFLVKDKAKPGSLEVNN